MSSKVILNDFVSRYELVKHLVGVYDGWRIPFGHTVEDEIINFPAADVVPVRHGQWRDTGSGQECSICKEIQYGYDTGRHYCPNCGADMREKKEK